MRSILATVMLIIVAVMLYLNTIGGENGAKRKVMDSGNVVNRFIEQIQP